MATALGILLLGILLAGVGGELFVRGSVGLARYLRIPPHIIGVTVAAFATSSPELVVGIRSAMRGTPGIALGDATGSNIVNIGLILGLALILSKKPLSTKGARQDMLVALLVPLVTLVFCLDGKLTRFDGALLLALFLGWLFLQVFVHIFSDFFEALESKEELVYVKKPTDPLESALGIEIGPVLLHCVLGLAALLGAGELVVTGGKSLGIALGLSPYVIGATVVAFGTSVPELATVLIAARKGHNELGIGAILGSNIFNGMCIVGISACIAPISLPVVSVSWGLGMGALLVATLALLGRTTLDRRCGTALLLLYGLYLVIILWGKTGGA